MAEWERRERHAVTATGPAVADAEDVIRALNQALSDYWVIAAEAPHSEVPPGAVTLSAAGGVLTVQIEHVEGAGVPEPEGDD